MPDSTRVDLKRLDEILAARGEPAYRAGQVWEWLAGGARSYEEMTNLPQSLRDAARRRSCRSRRSSCEREVKSVDGTDKALFETADGRPIEAVLMSYRDGRRSLCLSSQSGCPLTCNFCATGRMAFGRNLTASEILDQALHFRRSGEVNHVVFMGMGEPLMNLDAVIAACERLPDVGVSTAHTTISTVGWVPGIERLVDRGAARPARALAPRRRGRRALRPDAGQRPLPARRGASRPACAGARPASARSTSST